MIDQSDVTIVEYLLAVAFTIGIVAIGSFIAFKVAQSQSEKNK